MTSSTYPSTLDHGVKYSDYPGFLEGDFFIIGVNPSPVGKVIETVTRGDVYHAGIIVGVTYELHPKGVRWVTLQATPQGVVYDSLPYGARVVSVPLNSTQRQGIPAAADMLIGTKYSYLGDFAVGLHEYGLNIGPLLNNTHELFCSQTVDLVLHNVGFELFTDHRAPGLVTPMDLETLAINNNWLITQTRTS